MKIRVLFDNVAGDPRLTPSWGYAAWVQCAGGDLLFDTGGDGKVLLENLRAAGRDPGGVTELALSHADWDHTGGLEALLDAGARPRLHLAPELLPSLKEQFGGRFAWRPLQPGDEIIPGVFSTGAMVGEHDEKRRIEQALILDEGDGIAVLTGCAHPGISAICRRALELRGGPLRLAMGGFHLLHHESEAVLALIAELRELGLEKAAPSHCSGEEAMKLFEREMGGDFVAAGLGATVDI